MAGKNPARRDAKKCARHGIDLCAEILEPVGAHCSAVIYSLLQTAKANGIVLYLRLRRVLRELPAAKTVDEVEALLP